MTNSVTSGTQFGAGLLERLFQRADADKNNAVSVAEIEGLVEDGLDAETAQAIVSRHDKDQDGQLSLAEFSAVTMAPATMSSLLSVQEYKAADRDARRADDKAAVDALFARADLDGDGRLSREEYSADRALQFAQALDDEARPQHAFAAMPSAAEDGYFSPEEILVGRRLVDVLDPIDLDDPNLDPALKERIEAVRRLTPVDGGTDAPPPAPPDIETVMSDVVRNTELTDALMARLMRQLEFGALASEAAEGSLEV